MVLKLEAILKVLVAFC